MQGSRVLKVYSGYSSLRESIVTNDGIVKGSNDVEVLYMKFYPGDTKLDLMKSVLDPVVKPVLSTSGFVFDLSSSSVKSCPAECQSEIKDAMESGFNGIVYVAQGDFTIVSEDDFIEVLNYLTVSLKSVVGGHRGVRCYLKVSRVIQERIRLFRAVSWQNLEVGISLDDCVLRIN